MSGGHGHGESHGGHESKGSIFAGAEKALGKIVEKLLVPAGFIFGAMVFAPPLLSIVGLTIPTYMAGQAGLLGAVAWWAGLFEGKKDKKSGGGDHH